MRVRVIHGIDDLASDMAAIPVTAARDMADTVRSNAQSGVRYARSMAKQSAGKHGKHYPGSMDAEARGPLSWEYGPDPSKPQGGMSFEFGSRNQKPHLDLARSADLIAPRFGRDVANLPDRWFW